MLELCTVLGNDLTQDHANDMGSVWAKHQEMAGTCETEIPQKYDVSRRQCLIEDIQARLGHKENFVRSSDVHTPLYMYPGDHSDHAISKTFTKASKRELFVSSD